MTDTAFARLERARLSLEGLSVGDAFGERFFVPPFELLPMLNRRELPPGPWSWTDDSAMAMSVVEVLEAHEGIDANDLARAFARRYSADRNRGYGSTAHEILQAIGQGLPWGVVAAAPFGGTGSMGNGSAMRVAPVGAYFADDIELLVHHAALSAQPTHAHPEASAGAVAVALACAAHTQGADGEAMFEMVLQRTMSGRTRSGIEEAATLDLCTPVAEAARKLGNGSSIVCHDTVPLCLWLSARHADNFEEAMWATVSALGDRDTTCAIVGGMLACRTGVPAHFVERRESLGESSPRPGLG
jgi:ADP-ribosylglycohydrolase